MFLYPALCRLTHTRGTWEGGGGSGKCNAVVCRRLLTWGHDLKLILKVVDVAHCAHQFETIGRANVLFAERGVGVVSGRGAGATAPKNQELSYRNLITHTREVSPGIVGD